MVELELEKTYLVRRLPPGLDACPHKEIVDMYIPAAGTHPTLRVRKNGDRYEITKKQPAKEGDASEQTEHTIKLTKEEYDALAHVRSKRARKIRYIYMYEGVKGEVDVFQDELAGLVLVDFEFADPKKKDAFAMPDFCLADVTQDETFAGGKLCGKKYGDVEERLKELGYKRL